MYPWQTLPSKSSTTKRNLKRTCNDGTTRQKKLQRNRHRDQQHAIQAIYSHANMPRLSQNEAYLKLKIPKAQFFNDGILFGEAQRCGI